MDKKVNKYNKYIKKKSEIITPQEACDLWVKESYQYDTEYICNPYPHKCQRHLPKYLRNVKLTPVESAILNELRIT